MRRAGSQFGFIATTVVIACVVVAMILRLVKYAAAPTEQGEATIVAKRTEVTGGSTTHGVDGASHRSSSTWYHVTLQYADGSRREFDCSGRNYGLWVEGDRGLATWKDTVLKDFQRR